MGGYASLLTKDTIIDSNIVRYVHKEILSEFFEQLNKYLKRLYIAPVNFVNIVGSASFVNDFLIRHDLN